MLVDLLGVIRVVDDVVIDVSVKVQDVVVLLTVNITGVNLQGI